MCEHGHKVHWEIMLKETPAEAGSSSIEDLPLREKKVHFIQPNDIAQNSETPKEKEEMVCEGDVDSQKSLVKIPITQKTKTAERENRCKKEKDECNDREDAKLRKANKEVDKFIQNEVLDRSQEGSGNANVDPADMIPQCNDEGNSHTSGDKCLMLDTSAGKMVRQDMLHMQVINLQLSTRTKLVELTTREYQKTTENDSVVRKSNIGNDAIGSIASLPDHAVKCNECEVMLDDKYTLPSHIKRVHMKKSSSFTLVACPQCTYRHLSQDKMFMHINDVHYKKVKKEDSNRQGHMQLMHAQCTECHLLFKSQADLQRHNSDNHQFQCGLCDEVLPTKDKLQNHINIVHSCIRPPTSRTGMLNDTNLNETPGQTDGETEEKRTLSPPMPQKSIESGRPNEDQDNDDEQATASNYSSAEFTSLQLRNRGGRSKSSWNGNVERTKLARKQSTRGIKKQISIAEATYCKCGRGQGKGRMIACDNNVCPIEWFHFKCVRVTSKPKGEWYCPGCRGDKASLMSTKAKIRLPKESDNSETSGGFGTEGEEVVKGMKRSEKKWEDGLSPMAEEDEIAAERGCANSISTNNCCEQSKNDSRPLGAKRGRGRPPNNPQQQSSSIIPNYLQEGTSDGNSQSMEVMKEAREFQKKGEEGLPERAGIDKSAKQGCPNDISTTDLEQSKNDFGSPVAKRGRGRPPKTPQEQPSSNLPVSSVEETKQMTSVQASHNDAPQSMPDSKTGSPKRRGRYSCASCDFVSSSRIMLKKHAAANHSSEKTAAKAECGMCGYKGRNDVVLQIHYRKMHSAI